jgi:hypothetical protein
MPPRAKRSASVQTNDAVKVAISATKRAKKEPPTAKKASLDGLCFCLTGTMSMSRANLTASIEARGGSVAGSVSGKVTRNIVLSCIVLSCLVLSSLVMVYIVHDIALTLHSQIVTIHNHNKTLWKVTHVLSTDAEFANRTAKIIMAQAKKIPIVSEDFLDACEQAGGNPGTTGYEIAGSASVVPSATAKPASGKKATPPVKKEPAAKKAPASSSSSAVKKSASVKKEPAAAAKKKEAGVPRVNEHFHSISNGMVSKDDTDGSYLDCMLNQTEIKKNANKFYVLQVSKMPQAHNSPHIRGGDE